ncbi:chaperone modulator CbpM [Herbaspirillum sp. RTI4]|uniref:chaperone modulator CbpM n=1 Tax=Herbaspirillum sp. RTI4 TaxID=3048640 RepID=UPI002AB4E3CA|nr:chaperone modulator CbpM [Herbaspirillum sp. RTI4]MDY7577454.1 chaperone modulator CbpM [Herbaspirillum sp. RTI4]MEA9981730.1 chaperone modulator CbpM [Herbaspirillum sp. RTI4]
MKIDISEWVWLNDRAVCSAAHLLEVSGLSEDELSDLMDAGVIAAAATDAAADDMTAPQQSLATASFHLHYVVVARRARRLRDDFELDKNGVALALALIQRIDALQAELDAKRAG